MYAVVEYYNYPQNIFINLFNLYQDMNQAIQVAKELADIQSKNKNGETIDYVYGELVFMVKSIAKFTTDRGYGHMVYAVLELNLENIINLNTQLYALIEYSNCKKETTYDLLCIGNNIDDLRNAITKKYLNTNKDEINIENSIDENDIDGNDVSDNGKTIDRYVCILSENEFYTNKSGSGQVIYGIIALPNLV